MGDSLLYQIRHALGIRDTDNLPEVDKVICEVVELYPREHWFDLIRRNLDLKSVV